MTRKTSKSSTSPNPGKSSARFRPTASASSPSVCRTSAASLWVCGSAPDHAKNSRTKPGSPFSWSTWCSRAPSIAGRADRPFGDSIGGGLDAFTSKELVSYNVKVLDEHVPEAFDVVADLVRNPLFEPTDIEKEKGVILEELKMEVDNPEYQIHELSPAASGKGTRWGARFWGPSRPSAVSIAT